MDYDNGEDEVITGKEMIWSSIRIRMRMRLQVKMNIQMSMRIRMQIG